MQTYLCNYIQRHLAEKAFGFCVFYEKTSINEKGIACVQMHTLERQQF
jgi:hypothetical protein